MNTHRPKPYYTISTLVKAFQVLEFLVENGPLTISEVAAQQAMHKSAAHRFLSTLRDLGYVVMDPRNRYQASFRLFEMGMRVANNTDIFEIAKPYMKKLVQAHNETVNLGRLDGEEIIFLKKMGSTAILRTDLAEGSRVPAYCSAMGKAVMAFMSPEALTPMLNTMDMCKYTPSTFTHKKKFLKELANIQEKGYAMDNEEYVEGLCCIAVPVFDHSQIPQYSLSVAGPTLRLNKKRLTQIRKDLVQVGNELSGVLGCPSVNPLRHDFFLN
jgi:DNA-binding IclR family transcriptional regulator